MDFKETCRNCKHGKKAWETYPVAYHCQICGMFASGTLEPCEDFEEKTDDS